MMYSSPSPVGALSNLSPPDIAAIAKGLTKAQRTALGLFTGIPGKTQAFNSEAITELLIMRLVGVKLTPLGLSVRAYLMENGDETLVDSTR